MKVSTKGQVTIPLEIRERLGLQPGAEVSFEVEGGHVKIVPVKRVRRRGQDLIEQMRGRGTVRLSTDEIMALTRGEE